MCRRSLPPTREFHSRPIGRESNIKRRESASNRLNIQIRITILIFPRLLVKTPQNGFRPAGEMRGPNANYRTCGKEAPELSASLQSPPFSRKTATVHPPLSSLPKLSHLRLSGIIGVCRKWLTPYLCNFGQSFATP